MRIEEIQLKGFGKWQDEVFRFAPGINVFAAPNEAGKSTLLQGIFAALYGLKRDYVKGARYLPEYEKYLPWHQGEYETIIRYELAGKSYRLHRILRKEREQARIFLDPEWTELTDIYMEDRRRERDFVEKHTGLTRSLFTDITWIRREPLTAAEHLVPALSSSEESNPEVHLMLAGLERDLTAIGKKERAENTLLGKAGALVVQKEAELAGAESAWGIIRQLTHQIAEREAERMELEQQRTRVLQRQQRIKTQEEAWNEKWQKSYSTPSSASDWQWWERTGASQEERQIHEEAQAALAGLSHLQVSEITETTEMDQAVDQERLLADYEKGVSLRKRWEEGNLQLARLAATTITAGSRRQARGDLPSKAARQSAWLWGGSGLLAVLGIAAAAADQTGLCIALLLLMAAVAGVAWRKGRSRGIEQKRNQEIFAQAEELQSLQEELRRLENELRELVLAWDAPDWESFAAKREELLNRQRSFESNQLKAQLSRKGAEAQIMNRWGEQLRELLEQEQRVRLREYEHFRAEEQRIEERMQHVREQMARANGEMAAHDTVPVAKARGEYEEAVAGLRQLQRKREALQTAREALQEALAEWNRDISPGINQEASNVLTQITGGAYRDVRMDPHEGFSIRVLEPSRQMVLEQEQCSTGTQDQLYLAQRLSLAHQVSQQTEPLPLFFDDHFVHYDDERLRKALAYIHELSAEHQIFLFTCQERELHILERLLRFSDRHFVHTLG
ncbi:ATP-binding protein [Brevibacillus nitrificans]|uniref:ATP-binding protein n=1 Tax=Brevibacillus nitrificans TaxID=651560 RepID=UPI00262C9C48|nr:AAA family ATPase [Brevibacillus nitrificans]